MAEYFTKQDAEEFKADIKRYMGILAEDFQRKLDIVIDGQEGIKSDVAGLKQDVAGLKEDMVVLKQDVAGLKQDVGELKVRMASVEADLVAHRDNTEMHAPGRARTGKKKSLRQ